ncbi:MAG TPA: (d)CMP kinase, partial [Microthrixaceae bacterium]|nr:(d)CMP kinase [Microthrixaceae bacterium]
MNQVNEHEANEHEVNEHGSIEHETTEVIAIDGPAGSGKSTIAKALARRLGLAHLDTGAMYRAATFLALKEGVDLGDVEAIVSLTRSRSMDVGDRVVVDGVDATDAIRGGEVSDAVSVVAAVPGVRSILRERQREWARAQGGGVIEGRDIGTVVFPDARLKVYLTATPEVRARRRADEQGVADEAAIAEWAANIADR